MVFLVPDLERYTGGVRGFLYDFEPTAPGPHVATTAEVVEALRDLDATAAAHREDYEAFNRAYNARNDGQAAARVVDAVWGA
jgi:CDP-glycerol glycerophosphotransferase